jgi:hypothetical protein
MSEENKNLPAERPTTDIVGKDQEDLQKFMEEGMPGLGSLEEDSVKKMFDLYLSGKTYRQISNILRTPKVLVLFLSHKLQWFARRQEYLVELEETNLPRIIEARLMSQDFLLQAQQLFQKKIGVRMNRYILSGDEKEVTGINLKEFELYLKILDRLQKSVESPRAAGPLVGINVTEGATLTRTGNNTIEVTPKQTATDGMLKKFADMQRAKKNGP